MQGFIVFIYPFFFADNNIPKLPVIFILFADAAFLASLSSIIRKSAFMALQRAMASNSPCPKQISFNKYSPMFSFDTLFDK